MRLVDLDPHWMTTGDGRHGMGVNFDCPHCGGDQRLGVWFANPVDGGPPASPEQGPAPRWQRTGDTFETLSLTPSINAEASGHWHGWITAGDVT
jgi:hypothetical protein